MHEFNLLSPGLWYEKKMKLAINAGMRLSFYLGHALISRLERICMSLLTVDGIYRCRAWRP